MSKATVKAETWGQEISWVASHDCMWHEHLTAWHNAFWAADHHVRYDCGRREQASSGGYTGTSGVCPACNGSGTDLSKPSSLNMCITCVGTGATHWDMTPIPAMPLLADGTPDMGAMHGLKPGLPFNDEPHMVGGEHVELSVVSPPYYQRMSDEEYQDRLADAQAMDLYLKSTGPLFEAYEGGMQIDPTPSDNGHPLPHACAEDATVELGCITTELGRVDLEGYSEGASGGSAGWWARVRGHGRAW